MACINWDLPLVKMPDIKEDVRKEVAILYHDIGVIIEDRCLKLTPLLMKLTIELAQMNLRIWENKDKMRVAYDERDEGNYLGYLKQAHQLNGLRNQLKNMLMEECGDKDKSGRKTNFNTDGLQGWDIGI